MKAYQFESPSTGLLQKDVPIPVPERDQILVKIKATGLCHTDINIITGKDNTFFWKRPIILGHEIAGEIVQIGPDVTKHKVGDRVVSVITKNQPVTFGDLTTSPGIGKDGGFAQYVTLAEAKSLKIPEGVTYGQAAVATDAVATAYHAVVTDGRISKGSKIAIIGLGGLGLSAVQIATRRGAKVYGIDLDPRKFAQAAKFGAYSCAKSLEGFRGSRFDTIFDFAGSGTSTAAATEAVKAGGKVVLVGLSSRTAEIDTYNFVALNVTLQASGGSSLEEVKECLRMIADKELDPLIEEVSFDHLKDGLDRLARGDVVGRLFADPSKIQV